MMHTHIISINGQSLMGYEWKPKGPIRAHIHIIHGMVEHARRYDHVARILCNEGYWVTCLDISGHGQSTIDHSLGHVGDHQTWAGLVDDQWQYITHCRAQTSTSYPTYLIGHSMGSFIALSLSSLYSNTLNGVILVGSSYESVGTIRLGKWAT